VGPIPRTLFLKISSLTAAAVLLCGGVIGFAFWFSSRSDVQSDAAGVPSFKAEEQRPGVSPSTAGSSARPLPDFAPQFVGTQACAECHQDIAAAWRKNGMSRSWRRAVPGAGLPDSFLAGSPDVTDPNGPWRYRVRIDEGQIVQAEHLDPSEEQLLPGDTNHHLTVPASYFVGSGKHALAMVAEDNGYLTQLPVAWFASKDGWELNPGYELHNRRFDRPVLPGCVVCHGGRAVHVKPTRNRYSQPVRRGIECEHCHGPGQAHLARYDRLPSSNPGTADNNHSTDSEILNPGRLSAERSNDVCLQCHLQGDIVLYLPGADAWSFQPGDRLNEHRLDFLLRLDRTETSSLGVASHGARLMQSRCYLGSQRQLTCIHCHDPHVPVEAVADSVFDRRCRDCHSEEACGLPEKQRGSRDSGCVRCHMPQRPTREGQHLIFTDHWIRAPQGEGTDQTAVTSMPSAADFALPEDAPVELVPARPGAPADDARQGEAYVRLSESRGPHIPSLDRAVKLLSKALKSRPDDRRATCWLAVAETTQGKIPEAIARLTALRDRFPNDPKIRFRLGLALDRNGKHDLAATEYQSAIAVAPDWLEPYPLLTRLHLYRRHTAAAERLLQQQIGYRPSAAVWASLGLTRHLRAAAPEESLSFLDRALHLDPHYVPAWLNRGIVLTAAGKTPAAMKCFDTALRIDPTNRKARLLRNSLQKNSHSNRTRTR